MSLRSGDLHIHATREAKWSNTSALQYLLQQYTLYVFVMSDLSCEMRAHRWKPGMEMQLKYFTLGYCDLDRLLLDEVVIRAPPESHR